MADCDERLLAKKMELETILRKEEEILSEMRDISAKVEEMDPDASQWVWKFFRKKVQRKVLSVLLFCVLWNERYPLSLHQLGPCCPFVFVVVSFRRARTKMKTTTKKMTLPTWTTLKTLEVLVDLEDFASFRYFCVTTLCAIVPLLCSDI